MPGISFVPVPHLHIRKLSIREVAFLRRDDIVARQGRGATGTAISLGRAILPTIRE